MIKITNLNKYFYRKKSNEIHVINNTSLEFPETGLVTIVGESGSGKTTLMNVIGGLDDFNSGTIEIDDYKIKKYSSKKIDRIRNEKIGYIFQNYLLLSQRTVLDNLMIVLNMYELNEQDKNERIDYVLKAVGMLKYKKKKVSELSGGQQQRIAIARALIKAPSLILADEPTGNLDEKNTIQIMNIIKKISEKTLVILVSHEKNIAYSYSDYIIEVCDGKVTKQTALANNSSYKYEDDQNIYLQEYNRQNLENENVTIDFYDNNQSKIKLQIINKNGKFYVVSSEELTIINSQSEVKVLDSKRQVLDTAQEILKNEYYLEPLKYVKTPRLSFKEKVHLALSNLAKLKKRTKFLSFPLMIIILLTLLSVQSIVSASFINRQEIMYTDSRIYNITFEKGGASVSNYVMRYGFEDFYENFIQDNPNIEPVLDYSVKFSFNLPNFSQISNKRYDLESASLLTTNVLDEESLIYGRMPELATEIVVEKWVLENTLKDSSVSNFMTVTSFINKEIKVKDRDYAFKIVGIADNDENTMYFNQWALFDIFPSVIKKDGINICSFSEFLKYIPEDKRTEYEEKYFLDEGEALLSVESSFPYKHQDLSFNDDDRLRFSVIDVAYFYDCPYEAILPDSAYDLVLKSVLAYSYNQFDVLCENEEEKQQVATYIESVKDYYLSGELKATTADIFVDLDYPDVKMIIDSFSQYDRVLEPYIEDATKVVLSRVLITLTILLISVIIVFFTMKSYAIKNIYDIGVFRAIGIKKGSLAFVYGLEIFIISLKTTLVWGTICYLITNIIAGIPLIEVSFAITMPLYLITTFGLILLNVLVGILPVILYMKLTPSQLLSKYDI